MRFERKALVCICVVFLIACSQTPRAKELRFLDKGHKEFNKKNYSAAMLHFRNAIAAQPLDPEPYYQLALVHLTVNDDLVLAASLLLKATSLNPKHTDAQLKLAELFSLHGNKAQVEDAQKRALEVLKLLPDKPDALHTFAFTEAKLGNREHADELFVRTLQKAPGQLKSSVALAQLRVERKDFAGAEEVLKQATTQAPKSADAWMYLGDFYLAQNKTADAEQQFRHAVSIDPKHVRALLSLAGLQQRAGETQQADQTYRQIAALPDTQYRSVHAQYLFQSGKQAEALAELEKLHAADQANRNVRTELVKLFLTLNRSADAEKVLTAALKKNGRDTDALLQRSRIYLASKKYTEAQNDLNQVLHFQSQSAEAHYLLSHVYQGLGNTATQKQELGEALRSVPSYLAARVELAQALRTGGGAQAALDLLEQTPAEQKDSVQVAAERNWALLTLDQKAEARQGIDHVLSRGEVPEVLLQDAIVKLDQKDYAAARAAAGKVLAQSPDDVRALKLIMLSYVTAKQTSAGVQKVREYAQGRPGSAPVQEYLGELLLASGDRPGARKALEAAQTANANLPSIDFALVDLDVTEGRLDEARKRLEGVVASDPKNVVGRLWLGDIEMRNGKSAPAIEQYRKVLELDDKNVVALNQLAYLLADGKQPDEALKYAQMAKQLVPENATIDDTLGWIYFQKGMYTMAVNYLESAVARESKPLRKYHLSMAYLKAGDPVRGRQNLDAALKADPNLPEAHEAQQLFANAKK
jgi:tetratricopeptide (TPR) repeat protein